ncbi:unnamed protein product [Camellia sinensis]
MAYSPSRTTQNDKRPLSFFLSLSLSLFGFRFCSSNLDVLVTTDAKILVELRSVVDEDKENDDLLSSDLFLIF